MYACIWNLTHIREGVCGSPSTSCIHQIYKCTLLWRKTDSLVPHLCVPERTSWWAINRLSKERENICTNLLLPCVSWATISTREPYWYILPFGCSKAAAAPEPLSDRTMLFYEHEKRDVDLEIRSIKIDRYVLTSYSITDKILSFNGIDFGKW